MSKPKSARPSTPARSAHMFVLLTDKLCYTVHQ